jgi:hypothetical protein
MERDGTRGWLTFKRASLTTQPASVQGIATARGIAASAFVWNTGELQGAACSGAFVPAAPLV